MDPHTQYLIDGGFELGHITAVEHACLQHVQTCQRQVTLYGERAEHIQDFLQNTARSFLDTCGPTIRRMLCLLSAPTMQFGLKVLLECMEQEIQTRAQHDLGVCEDGLGTLRRMLGTSFQDEADKVFSTVEDIRFDVVERYVSERFAPRLAQWQSDMELLEDSVRWYQALSEEQKQLAQVALHAVMPPAEREAPESAQEISVSELTACVRREETATSKASIKKAFKLFSRLGKEQSVRMLVAGHEVTLSHPDSPFKFVLKAHSGNWLHRRTDQPGHSSPFSIHLLTKDDVHLAQLCVFFDNTPVLDQLLALTMFVETGQETLILEKANWFGLSESVETPVGHDKSRRKVVGILQETAPALLSRIGYNQNGEPLATGPEANFRFAGPFFEQKEHWVPYKGPVRSWLTDILDSRGLRWGEQTGRTLTMPHIQRLMEA